MVVVFVLVALAVLAVLALGHWYVWRRLVRDTTRGPGPARRAGTALFVVGPLLMVSALVAERSGAPFWLQRTLAWPGFLWMALALYLLLAVAAGEVLRPLLHRALARRATRRTARADTASTTAPAPLARTAAAPHAGAAAAAPATQAPSAGVPESPAASGPTAPDAGPAPVAVGAHAERAPDARVAAASPARPGPSAPAPHTPDENDPTGPAAAASLAPTRRLFVSRVVGGTAAAAAAVTVGQGTYGVLRGPRVKRVTVALGKLPRAAHGFRIAVVSDIHLGPILGRDFTQRVVDTVNATQPDLIAVVGDLMDGSVKDLGPAAAPLAGLRARHGAYFVTGNHEYFSGAEQWIAEVRTLGLHPLENARSELPYFDLAGVNDLQGESEGQGPDFDRALAGRDPARACVLLAHQPVQIHESVRHGVDLQLSGHTHGGQLWPGNLVAAAANPTVAGLDRYGDTQLYVTRGAGAWGPPTRVGAPSDVTVIELAATRA
ncbi:metallophosphoesterase [Streptomyces bungoensis]|uniref:metallophosphoesterase n=1 Tax=Streptomyces bungoensis TaxID=285568 RepID=UPI0036A2A88B